MSTGDVVDLSKQDLTQVGDSLPTHLNVDSSIIQEGMKFGDGQNVPVVRAQSD